MAKGTCTIDGCDRPAERRRMCGLHYRRLLRSGELPRVRGKDPALRFWPKVDKRGPAECWPWKTPSPNGYGFIGVNGRAPGAHRFSYELHYGPIPEGLEIDHLCHTDDLSCPGGVTCPHRACVNPTHLEPVTRTENLHRSRGRYFGKPPRSHCKRGHEFTPENTGRDSRGDRYCRICMRAAQRRHYYAKRPSCP